MKNLNLLDPEDLVFMVAGMLYCAGHFPVRLDEQSINLAIPAAVDLLRAFGLNPSAAHRRRFEG